MGIVINHQSDFGAFMNGAGQAMRGADEAYNRPRDRAFKKRLELAAQARADAEEQRMNAQTQSEIESQGQERTLRAQQAARQAVTQGQQDETYGFNKAQREKGASDYATAQQDARTRQSAEFDSIGGAGGDAQPGAGGDGKDADQMGGAQASGVEIPSSLPPKMWGDYHAARQTLQGMTDPKQRQEFLDQKRGEWSHQMQLDQFDDMIRTMSRDVEDGAFQADPQAEPDENETQLLGSVYKYKTTAADMRDKLAKAGPQSSQGIDLSPVRTAYDKLKEMRGSMIERRRVKSESLSTLDQLRATPGLDPRKSDRLGAMQSQIHAGLLDPKQAVKEANTIMSSADDEYGHGRNWADASDHARATVSDKARTHARELLQADQNYKKWSTDDRLKQLNMLTMQLTPQLAEEHGWDTSEPLQQGPQTGQFDTGQRGQRSLVPGDSQVPSAPGPDPNVQQRPPPSMMSVPTAAQRGFTPKAGSAAPAAPPAQLSSDEQAHVQARRKMGWKDEDIAAELKQIRGSRQ